MLVFFCFFFNHSFLIRFEMYSDGRVSNYFGMGKSQSSGTFCEKTRKSSNFGVGMVIELFKALRILWGLGKSNVGGNWGINPKISDFLERILEIFPTLVITPLSSKSDGVLYE